MKRLFLIVLLISMFAGVSAAAEVDLDVVENPSMVAGESARAVLDFNYEGDQLGRSFEPFAMVLTVDHPEGELSHDYFDASGNMSYSWAGNDYRFDLECVSGPEEVSSVNQTGAFYSTSSTVVNESQLLCVPENTLSVLKSNTFVDDGRIELKFSTSPRVAPGELNITYDFGSFMGFPGFDPLLEADENGTVELEDEGVRIGDLPPDSEIGVVGYSALNVEDELPEGQSRALSYYEFEPRNETDGDLELEYSIDEQEFESPRLYRCNVVDGDCSWVLVENQSSSNGVLEAELSRFSVFGVFTSREEEVVVETVDEGGGGGTTAVTRTETETETEVVNNTEVETALRPTAAFDILYTSPDIREDVVFNASNSYDSDAEIESYEWSFGKQGEVVEASFPENETVNVTLTVTDSQGAQDSTTKTLNSPSSSSESSEIEDVEETDRQSITGQFIESPSGIAAALIALLIALSGLLVYSGRIEIEAFAEKIRERIN